MTIHEPKAVDASSAMVAPRRVTACDGFSLKKNIVDAQKIVPATM